MRNINRIDEVLTAVAALWKENPDFRLGQLIYSIASNDIFNIEDDKLLEEINTVIKKAELRKQQEKEYHICACDDENNILIIAPNEKIYHKEKKYPVYLEINDDDDSNPCGSSIALTLKQTKELKSYLEEIISIIEEEN